MSCRNEDAHPRLAVPLAVRHRGEQAFLIYVAPPGRTVYAMPLKLEDGEWKLGAIAAELPGT
jgi:hypothetical protein